MKKNEPYLQMPVKETFLYGRLISGKSLGDVIYIKARRIVLDEILLERQRYEKRKASNPGFLDLGYICCHENGQCHNRSFYIKPYNRLMEQSGISRLPWRRFRNTYATILAQYQVNTKTISKCLGHSSPEFTSRVYVAFQKQETYDISKIIEDYVLTHHLLPKKQGSVEQRPYQLPDALAYRNYFYD